MFQKTILAFRVFRHSLLIVSILLTTVLVFTIYQNAATENLLLPIFIIGRMFIFVPILLAFTKFKKKEFIYYRNLGLSKYHLLIYLWIFDTILSIAILNLSYAIIR